MRISSPVGMSKNCKPEFVAAEMFVNLILVSAAIGSVAEACWVSSAPTESLKIKAKKLQFNGKHIFKYIVAGKLIFL